MKQIKVWIGEGSLERLISRTTPDQFYVRNAPPENRPDNWKDCWRKVTLTIPETTVIDGWVCDAIGNQTFCVDDNCDFVEARNCHKVKITIEDR